MMKSVCAGATLVLPALAEILAEPVRMRVSSELIERIFHKGDQQMLQNFQGLELDDILDGETTVVSDLRASLEPELIDEEAYDFVASLNHPEHGYLGLHGDGLKVTGEGQADGNAFTFESTVSLLKMEMDKVAETS